MVAIAIVLAATFVLAVGSVFGVYPAYHHHKVAQHHRATLANIDRLERELGIGDYFDETFNREIAPLVAQDGDKLSPDVEPAARSLPVPGPVVTTAPPQCLRQSSRASLR